MCSCGAYHADVMAPDDDRLVSSYAMGSLIGEGPDDSICTNEIYNACHICAFCLIFQKSFCLEKYDPGAVVEFVGYFGVLVKGSEQKTADTSAGCAR